ncbi:MAG: SGNH/GDSL hydrolase family protein [Bacteroidia bacterium]|nr:SGNH/GDSL hydrolase family protein [Bacteroidia bacterium]
MIQHRNRRKSSVEVRPENINDRLQKSKKRMFGLKTGEKHSVVFGARFLWTTTALATALWGCAPELAAPTAHSGTLNLERIVAIGDSYFAGYADNALHREAQTFSPAAIFAEQCRKVGAGAFKTPLTAEGPGLGTPILRNNARYVLKFGATCKFFGGDTVELLPFPADSAGDANILQERIGAQGPYQNLALPLMRAHEATVKQLGDPSRFPQSNPYFWRFAPSTSASVLDAALEQRPTFAIVWVGAGDYLIYGAQGGVEPLPGLSLAYLTPPEQFRRGLDTLLRALSEAGVRMVVGNLPRIASLPVFRTIPFDTVRLSAEKALQLRQKWNADFRPGKNPLWVKDKSGAVRFMHPDELPLLTALDEIKCRFRGFDEPLEDAFFLERSEIEAMNAAVEDYNRIIAELARKYGAPLADLNALFKTMETGTPVDGMPMSMKFIEGGFFSLDGIHLTPRGNALVANEFIKAANAGYGAAIPLARPTEYRAVPFPK